MLKGGWSIDNVEYVVRGYRKGVEVEMKLKVVHWSVERNCQMGVVIQDGMSSDWWGAQWRLSCTMTVSYNAEYVERGCRKGV